MRQLAKQTTFCLQMLTAEAGDWVCTTHREATNESDLKALVQSLCIQFSIWDDRVGGLRTGGISALEEGFKALGWTDPQPRPGERCERPGCMKRFCGYDRGDRLCFEHLQAAKEEER
jgi:hypothetical protein